MSRVNPLRKKKAINARKMLRKRRPLLATAFPSFKSNVNTIPLFETTYKRVEYKRNVYFKSKNLQRETDCYILVSNVPSEEHHVEFDSTGNLQMRDPGETGQSDVSPFVLHQKITMADLTFSLNSSGSPPKSSPELRVGCIDASE